MTDDIEFRRKRLRFRSTHRGTKELDLLLGAFSERNLATMSAEEIVGLNPEAWMKNESGEWTGEVNVALKSERGNGDADYADVDFDITYRRKDDRFRAKGEWDYDVKIKDNTGQDLTEKDEWSITGTYDYFFNKSFYILKSL